MERTKPWVIVLIFVGMAVLTFTVRRLLTLRGFNPQMYGMEAGLVMLGCSAILGWLGWQVRRLKGRKQTWISAVGAARVAAAALATTHGGALIAGRFTGVLLLFITRLELENTWGMLWQCLFSTLCALAMLAVGWWTEIQCVAGGDDDKDKKDRGLPGTAPAPA